MWAKIIKALRDLVLLGLGGWIIYKASLKDNPDPMQFIIGALVAISPGTLAGIWLGQSTNETGESESSSSPRRSLRSRSGRQSSSASGETNEKDTSLSGVDDSP